VNLKFLALAVNYGVSELVPVVKAEIVLATARGYDSRTYSAKDERKLSEL
jgi:hypothetical protein